eukprot:4452995-Pyramimonas_sp.AAC.1
MPIPGLGDEPPAADPAQTNQDDDPYYEAYKELYYKLILLLEDYPGVWRSYNSGEKQELLHPTWVKYAKAAHALTWIVYEQFLIQINDIAEANDANESRLIAERNIPSWRANVPTPGPP